MERKAGEKEIIDDDLLIKDFYEWSESKKKFPEKSIVYALNWMKDEKCVPSN
jgi:hypothetical protein